MLALQETQKVRAPAEASAYRTLLAAFDSACQNLKTCSANIQALLLEVNTGLAESERRARIASTAQAYEAARTECMVASANLNAFLIAELVSSAPAVKVEAAPDR
jgi:hypothetical protein